MRIPNLWRLLKETFKGWRRAGATQISAALAYYAVFSIAPLLVIITFFVGLIHKGDTLEQVRAQFKDFVSPEAADLIARGVVNAALAGGSGFGYTAIAIVMLLVGASAFTHALQSAVDAMWDLKPQSGKRRHVLRRGWTLLFGVGMGVFLQISVVVNSQAAAYRQHINALLPGFQPVWQWVDNGISFLVIAVIYGLSYKLLPSAKVAWTEAAAGAIVSTLLFSAGRWVVALYVFQGSFTSVYGAAGSLMVVLVWLYYSSLVFLFGARFTRETQGEFEGR